MLPVTMLKRCWKSSPHALRHLVLDSLCRIFAEKRTTVAGCEPLFVCGAFCSNSGLAQSARLYARHHMAQSEEVHCVDITTAMLQPRDTELPADCLSLQQAQAMRGRGTVVIHANPPQFQLALCRLGRAFLRRKRIIAYWAWELSAIPSIWRHGLRYVDEVEVPSTFVQRALQDNTDKRVSVVPHPVPPPARRREAHAPDGVLRCLFIFDAASSLARKNPQAALRAFARAFAPGEAELTFKISNPQADEGGLAAFRAACARVPGVHLCTGPLTAAELEELYLRHDVYLSLHRSEGYGLTIREAMLHGLHVVATGWSGNMDFMHGPLAHPVPFRLVPVGQTSGPYRGLRADWAEPDADAAAAILKRLRQTLCVPGHA